jgi:hypothetical protein
MVKTTLILDDEVYRELVQESIEKYGSARKLSRVLNEKLREAGKKSETQRSTVKLGVRLSEALLRKMTAEGWEEATKWKQ